MSSLESPRPTLRISPDALAVALIAALGAAITWAFRRNALDDPFVTYRYVENILAGVGPVYNVGESALSTTALGYAGFLAAIVAVGRSVQTIDVSLASNLVSGASLTAAALAVFLLARRHGQATAGLIAAIALVSARPLISTFGLETCLLLALVTWSAYLFDRDRPTLAAVLLAAATVVRADGAVAFACLLIAWLAMTRRWRAMARPLIVFAAIVAPYELTLVAIYGSPIPTTLAAKQAQASIAGWPDFASGLAVLAAEHVAWSRLFLWFLPIAAIGIVALARQRWALPLILWALAQSVTYQVLGVASYTWYYAPLVPAVAILFGLGAATVARRNTALAILVAAPLFLAQEKAALALTFQLPEPRARAYQTVGRWLAANTPLESRVAVMEVGIMGYYAQRPMVDLLGLIRPDTIDALRRQDFFWTIAAYQPNYVVLTGKNPLWFQFAAPDHWFHQFFAPVYEHAEPGFWGSPMTVYRRTAPRRESPESIRTDIGRFGSALTLARATADRTTARRGDFLTVELEWIAAAPVRRDYAAFVHVVSSEPLVIAQHDTPINASRWPVGKPVAYFHPMRLPDDASPGVYTIEVGVYLPEEPLTRLPPLDSPRPRNVGIVGALTIVP
ncbi:MAG: hypothetical protein EPO26_03390 [Chloroflexota bacterium]|nr:MAG: hypothetical protein EPO26_03390 [Chloroflexota bacterium]